MMDDWLGTVITVGVFIVQSSGNYGTLGQSNTYFLNTKPKVNIVQP